MFKNKTIIFALFVLTLALISAGCSEAQRSAGMALDNANSVVKSSKDTLWAEPGPTATPKAR